MGTIFRIGNWRVMIYTDDHAPSHIHLVGPDGRAKIALNCPEGPAIPIEARGISSAVLKIALQRGEAAAAVEPRAVGAKFDAARNRLILELEGDVELTIPAAALGFPANTDLSDVRVEGGGFDLYFPAIDDGAFVPALARAAIEHRLAA